MNNQTIGEKRVRTTFNISEDTLVSDIKNKSAELINLCNSMRSVDTTKFQSDADGAALLKEYTEYIRLLGIAEEHYETAAMYAVKAATFFPPETSPFNK
jgi:hypothetical protein